MLSNRLFPVDFSVVFFICVLIYIMLQGHRFRHLRRRPSRRVVRQPAACKFQRRQHQGARRRTTQLSRRRTSSSRSCRKT